MELEAIGFGRGSDRFWGRGLRKTRGLTRWLIARRPLPYLTHLTALERPHRDDLVASGLRSMREERKVRARSKMKGTNQKYKCRLLIVPLPPLLTRTIRYLTSAIRYGRPITCPLAHRPP